MNDGRRKLLILVVWSIRLKPQFDVKANDQLADCQKGGNGSRRLVYGETELASGNEQRASLEGSALKAGIRKQFRPRERNLGICCLRLPTRAVVGGAGWR